MKQLREDLMYQTVTVITKFGSRITGRVIAQDSNALKLKQEKSVELISWSMIAQISLMEGE